MTEDVKELQRLLYSLMEEIKDLKHRLSKYENPKNSNNSSVPPSKDENRPKRKSLIGYFYIRQYIPFKRMQEIFNDVFNTPISEEYIIY